MPLAFAAIKALRFQSNPRRLGCCAFLGHPFSLSATELLPFSFLFERCSVWMRGRIVSTFCSAEINVALCSHNQLRKLTVFIADIGERANTAVAADDELVIGFHC